MKDDILSIRKKAREKLLKNETTLIAARCNERWLLSHDCKDILDEHDRFKLNEWLKILVFSDTGFKCSKCNNETDRPFSGERFPILYCSNCLKEKTKEDRKKTSLERHGFETAFQRKDIQEKTRKNIDHALLQKKIRETHLERRGYEHHMKDPLFVASLGDHHWKNDEIRNKIYKTKSEKSKEKFSKILSKTYSISRMEELHLLYKSGKSIYEISSDTGYSVSHLCALMFQIGGYDKVANQSHPQKILQETIDADIVANDRKVLSGKEIDIWIPEHNLGIEYHGLYWHSENNCEVNFRHFEKYELSIKAGVTLLQFFSNEVEGKNDVVMSMINNHLGKSQKIFARKCHVQEISSKEHSEFCQKNHLQGSAGASIRLGLFHEGILVSVMSFGKSRFDKKHEWEMIRYCSLLNHNIVGGASKMWKHFLKTYNPSSVVTYADARISQGKLYETLGFTFSHHSSPNFWYTKDCKTLESRIKFQKHKLKDLLESFDENLTEKENMIMNGYRIVYDAGNLIYEMKKAP